MGFFPTGAGPLRVMVSPLLLPLLALVSVAACVEDSAQGTVAGTSPPLLGRAAGRSRTLDHPSTAPPGRLRGSPWSMAPAALHTYAVRRLTRVPYTRQNDDTLVMDLYVPQGTAYKPPMLLWFPGGGFQMYILGYPVFEDLAAQHGLAVAVVYYYLSVPPAGQFPFGTRSWPQAYAGGKEALRYLRGAAASLGIDGERLMVGGYSAGGTVAAYLAATSGLNLLEPGPVADPSTRVRGAYLASAPVDFALFAPGTPDLQRRLDTWPVLHQALTLLLGLPPEDPLARSAVTRASPVSVVTRAPGTPGASVLWMVSHGLLDPVVPVEQSHALVRALGAVGAAVRHQVYPDLGHDLAVVREDDIARLGRLVRGLP